MNFLETLFRQPLTIALGWTLLHFLWQGALIALLFTAANLFLRRSSAAVRYGVACVAMLLMLAASVGTFLWLSSPPALAVPTPRGESVLWPAGFAAGAVAPALVTASVALSAGRWLEGHLAWLVCFWSAGVMILSLRTLGGWMFAQALKHRSTRPAEPAWQHAVARLAVRLEVRSRIALCASTLAKVPTVIGWLRPVILLPVSALAGLTPQMTEAVLAHELAHIRRHDYLLNMLQTAIETLLFYHPAVWWVGKKIRQERENCCDDLAVAACGDALVYARALTELEQLRSVQPQLVMAATGGSLLARIRRLVGVRQPMGSASSAWMAGIAAVLTLGAVWAARPLSINYYGRALLPHDRAKLTLVAQTASPETEPPNRRPRKRQRLRRRLPPPRRVLNRQARDPRISSAASLLPVTRTCPSISSSRSRSTTSPRNSCAKWRRPACATRHPTSS